MVEEEEDDKFETLPPSYSSTPNVTSEQINSSKNTSGISTMIGSPSNRGSPSPLTRANTTIFRDIAGPQAGRYIKLFMTQPEQSDPAYGIRADDEKDSGMKMGDMKVIIREDTIYIGEENEFPATRGVLELLFKAIPDSTYVKESDKQTYKNILELTNVHKNSLNRLKGSKSDKYHNIIKPMFTTTTVATPMKRTGTGLHYWDNPNELVERLKLLIAEKYGGNNGHHNEMVEILAELKEAGYIKGSLNRMLNHVY